jgi:hypothetical protein
MEESWAFGAGFAGGLGDWLFVEPFQKGRGRFVIRILGNQLSPKCFRQHGGGEALDGLLRAGEAGFDPVGEGEQVFDSADDFLLFGKWCQGKRFYAHRADIEMRLRDASLLLIEQGLSSRRVDVDRPIFGTESRQRASNHQV